MNAESVCLNQCHFIESLKSSSEFDMVVDIDAYFFVLFQLFDNSGSNRIIEFEMNRLNYHSFIIHKIELTFSYTF